MSMPSTNTIKVVYFCSDTTKDQKHRDELEKHLSILKRQGVIATWHKGMIGAGKDIQTEIDQKLNEANIILPLISSDFIAHDYNWDIVAKLAMERHKSRKARVIPVLLRPVEDSWKSAFPKIKALPENEKPITSWKPYDNAFTSIAEGIREAVKDINSFPFQVNIPVQQIASFFKGTGTAFSDSPKKSKRRSKKKSGSVITLATVVAVGGLLYQASNSTEIILPKPSQTIVSTQNISPIGWIEIGKINRTSTDLRHSTINPSLVPSTGALITVDKTVNLWKNVRYSYSSPLPTQNGMLKPNQKLIILKVKPLTNPKSNSFDIQIWAQVGRCNQTCGN